MSSEEEDSLVEEKTETVESLSLMGPPAQAEESSVPPEVLAENLALQREFELQCEEDRRLKRTPKKRSPSAVTTDTGASAEEKESIIDHPTLKRIFSLDVNLRYEEFLGFFRDLKLKMEERDGGITVWFNSELSKTFHRPHTQGNVVPYYDLRVAKRSLKLINIKLSF